MRKRYVQINGELIEVSADHIPEPRSPMIVGDIAPYRSMVDGSMIQGRAQHRAHLKAHKLIEVGNETKYLKPKPKQLPPGLKETIARIAYEKLRY